MGGLFSVWIRYHTMMGFYFVMLLVVLKFVLQHFGASFHIHYFQVVMGVSLLSSKNLSVKQTLICLFFFPLDAGYLVWVAI